MKLIQLLKNNQRPVTDGFAMYCLLFICALVSLGFPMSLQAGTQAPIAAPLARPTLTSNKGVGLEWLENSKNNISQRNAYNPAAAGPVLALENLDHYPANDQLVFSLIRRPWRRLNPVTPFNANHDTVMVRLHNKGTANLTIGGLNFSRPNSYKVVKLGNTTFNPATMLPITVTPGSSVDVSIRYINDPTIELTRVKITHDTLSVISNDTEFPNKIVGLHALLQYAGESGNEPTVNELFEALYIKSRTGYDRFEPSRGEKYHTTTTEEVGAQYYARVDPSKPVTIQQLAAYHGCCSQTETLQWYGKGKATMTPLFTHIDLDGQSLLPRMDLPNKLAIANFYPSGAFGLRSQNSYTDTIRNVNGKIGLRVYKAIDGSGKFIPNAYIITMDYVAGNPNYDYQDNIYYITNIKPEDPNVGYSELAATPLGSFDFGDALLQSSKLLNMKVKSLGQVETNSPDVNLTGVQIVGTNMNEFTATLPADVTLSPQESGTIVVKFAPTSAGLKNADLLVYHTGTSTSPLRIPLYGIGESGCTTLDLTKRIKSAATSSASVTIKGKVWESDIDYRRGNVKLDNTGDVSTAIIGTDDDPLYRSYLSSNANLDEIRYEIPVAPGKYQVRLHFAENYFNAPENRVFDIRIENQLVLSNFDIYKEVGYKAALAKDFMVTSDDTLSLRFNPSVNRVAISALELFRVNISNDVSCNPPAVDSCTAAGNILREQWNNVTGTAVSAIPVGTAPNSTSQLTSFEGPVNISDNYGTRIRGYLCIPQTGSYTFWIAGDDNCQLWLSTDDTPGNKVLLASVPGATSRRLWTKYPQQKSTLVSLTKGKRYYIEALQKEGTSNDHLSVAWAINNGAPVVIPGSVLSPYQSAARMALDEPITAKVSSLSITPNPSQGQATIKFSAGSSGKTFVALYDLQGALVKVLFNGEMEAGSTHSLPLEAGNLRSGLYLVRLHTAGQTTYKKVVITK